MKIFLIERHQPYYYTIRSGRGRGKSQHKWKITELGCIKASSVKSAVKKLGLRKEYDYVGNVYKVAGNEKIKSSEDWFERRDQLRAMPQIFLREVKEISSRQKLLAALRK